MSFVDAYMIPVPAANEAAYKEMSSSMTPVFHDHGALAVVECWASDVPAGEVTSMPMAVKCKDDEVVAFGIVKWPSKEVRDAAQKAMWDDPRMKAIQNVPFDGKRMILGGFETFVDA